MQPKVLIVDDNPMVRSSLSRILRAEGLYVLQTDSAESAFGMFRNHDIAVAIVDHLMPGTKGTRFLRWLRDNHPATGRIMLTAWDIKSVREDALGDAEAHRFLTKPWDPHELRKVVRDAVQLHEKLKKGDEPGPGHTGGVAAGNDSTPTRGKQRQ